jgi:hypothetical protein
MQRRIADAGDDERAPLAGRWRRRMSRRGATIAPSALRQARSDKRVVLPFQPPVFRFEFVVTGLKGAQLRIERDAVAFSIQRAASAKSMRAEKCKPRSCWRRARSI